MKSHTRNTYTTKIGFTLIELLVVIAIIAILAAILFPVFAKVREKARQTECLSNMKQLNLAMMQYVEDYDEAWPAACVGTDVSASNTAGGENASTPWTTQATWAYVIYPYVKSMGVYVCPDDPYPPKIYDNFSGADQQDIAKTYIPIIQYNEDGQGPQADTNSAIMINGHDANPPKNMTDSQIPYPSTTMWLAEAGPNIDLANGQCYGTCADVNVSSLGLWVFYRYNYVQPGGSMRNYVADNHTGGSNWCFGDGHVHWYSVTQTINSNFQQDYWVRLKD